MKYIFDFIMEHAENQNKIEELSTYIWGGRIQISSSLFFFFSIIIINLERHN